MARKRRGVALIVVLWTVLLLATITAVAGSASRGSANLVATLRAQAIGRSMAASGVTAATAEIERVLRTTVADSSVRHAFLDDLERRSRAGRALVADTIGDAVFAVAVIDVDARLDVNAAGADGWRTFLRGFVDGRRADALAAAIEAYARGTGSDGTRDPARTLRLEAQSTRDSVAAALLGRPSSPVRRAIESVDELLEIPGFDLPLVLRISPFLTADGDGRVNRSAAPPEVLAAASGSLVDHPARIMLVSRGWQRGHPLTREIEAIYHVAEDGLRLVRWRERDR